MAFVLSVLVLAGAASPLGAADKQLDVYFIGNSLTMSLTLDRVHGLFQQRGIDLQFGSQLSGGKSLLRHLKYESEPNQKWGCWETSVPSGDTFLPHPNHYMVDPKTWRFGYYDRALPEFRWDALVVQPYGSSLHDDMQAVTAFVELARKNSPDLIVYVYETWPRRPRKTPPDGSDESAKNSGEARIIDYPALWTAQYTATIDQTDKTAANNSATRDYFHKLMAALQEKFPDMAGRVRLIPVGEILFVLDGKIKAGELLGLQELATRKPEMLPGMKGGATFADGVNVLYADPIHFNPMPHKTGVVGNFVSGTTMFTALSGQNPVGLSAESYGFDPEKDAELVRSIQEIIWSVVTSDPATGVHAGDPGPADR